MKIGFLLVAFAALFLGGDFLLAPGIGGTGIANPAAHGIMLGEGSSPMSVLGPCATGEIFVAKGGAADPTCLAQGTDGYSLVADSTQANGLRWSPGLTVSGTISGTTTTASHNFSANFSGTPQCVVTPDELLTSWYISSESASTITVTYAASGTASFDVICHGSGNAAW